MYYLRGMKFRTEIPPKSGDTFVVENVGCVLSATTLTSAKMRGVMRGVETHVLRTTHLLFAGFIVCERRPRTQESLLWLLGDYVCGEATTAPETGNLLRNSSFRGVGRVSTAVVRVRGGMHSRHARHDKASNNRQQVVYDISGWNAYW